MCYIHTDTVKTVSLFFKMIDPFLIQNCEGNVLQISFEVDTKVNCNVRVSTCVTEEKNDLNVPTMFYTPNKEDYV